MVVNQKVDQSSTYILVSILHYFSIGHPQIREVVATESNPLIRDKFDISITKLTNFLQFVMPQLPIKSLHFISYFLSMHKMVRTNSPKLNTRNISHLDRSPDGNFHLSSLLGNFPIVRRVIKMATKKHARIDIYYF